MTFSKCVSYFKKGNKNDVASYRLISITCIAYKVMETIIKWDVLDYLLMGNLISKQQHGFVSRRSMCAQLLETLNDWTAAVNNKKRIDVCYVDFKSAFDTVSREKLLCKLISYGITGHLLPWLTAFLTNRKQAVVINNATSELVSVRSGVPEGSVIGPLLFLIYINEIGDGLKCCFYKLFADDLKIYYMFNYVDGNIAIDGLQKDLILIEKFAHDQQLIICIAKTYIMHIGFKNPNFKYFLNGVEIQCKEVANDLGFLVRNDLSFDDHINTMCTKAYKVINSIFRCFC